MDIKPPKKANQNKDTPTPGEVLTPEAEEADKNAVLDEIDSLVQKNSENNPDATNDASQDLEDELVEETLGTNPESDNVDESKIAPLAPGSQNPMENVTQPEESSQKQTSEFDMDVPEDETPKKKRKLFGLTWNPKGIVPWMKKNKLKTGLILLVLLLLIGGAVYAAITLSSTEEPVVQQVVEEEEEEPEPEITTVASPLTGEQVEKEIAERPVIGVMINNSTQARPHSGLDSADVVFEAIAEGGITRYIAFFQTDFPKFLGPVRSLRPYYLDWALGFNSSVAHVGGSPQALEDAKTFLGNKDLDQFALGTTAFTRESFRNAPHNVYTDTTKLFDIIKSRNITKGDFTPISRESSLPAESSEVTEDCPEESTAEECSTDTRPANPQALANIINITFSSDNYNLKYEYDSSEQNYRRFLGGDPHTDRETTKQYRVDVVVVMKARYTIINTGHNEVGTTEGGAVSIFQNGKVIEGTWSKASKTAPIVFKGSTGAEILLAPGKTWISVIPANQTVTYQ